MKFILILASIIYLSLSNIYCLAKEVKQDESILKVGLIVPLSGKHQEIGKSVLNSIRLALSKINDDQIEIFPKDNNSNPEKTLFAAKQLEKEGIQIVIGPIFHQNLIYLEEVQNLTFLSLSNKTTTIPRNVITMGINANSQINAIVDFIKKENLNKVMKLFRKYFILLMVFLNIIGFSGCRKNYSIEISNNPENFRDIFEIFWNKMNANYVYWDIDTTNWDNVHIKYKPLFAQLDIKNYADIKKSIQYFNEMTDGLIDNHYYINFLSRSIADSIVYPSFILPIH